MMVRGLVLATLLSMTALAQAGPTVQAAPKVQMGFSPEGSARQLVLDTIEGAQQRIQMLAYSFESPDIAQALADASKRGVQVQVVVDHKRNQDKASRQAMDLVTRNGVQLRTTQHYRRLHDKSMIVDGNRVQTGSFNYAPHSEAGNSENVVVMHDMPEVSAQYLAHWQSRWDTAQPYPGH